MAAPTGTQAHTDGGVLRYRPEQRAVQDRFDSRRIADRINERLARATIDDAARAFIAACDMCFLATADADGVPTCSYKGGDPGFVKVLDERTLALPSYDGNGMFLSIGNVLANPAVGLLFVDFAGGGRLRVQGRAAVEEGPLLRSWTGAQLALRVTVTAVFPNCNRYVHRLVPAERSPYVPRRGHQPPVPGWKRAAWAHDALPAADPARRGGS
ncbi:MAG TPA: pyridoxamine 5'-phosphate oxidase family protein [Egibacteraceae bacterium]|nr:pyridoxamine 5'-phosphate oxidase family protein [Egibacteraceae bacterium]